MTSRDVAQRDDLPHELTSKTPRKTPPPYKYNVYITYCTQLLYIPGTLQVDSTRPLTSTVRITLPGRAPLRARAPYRYLIQVSHTVGFLYETWINMNETYHSTVSYTYCTVLKATLLKVQFNYSNLNEYTQLHVYLMIP